jgi:aqualysin 1
VTPIVRRLTTVTAAAVLAVTALAAPASAAAPDPDCASYPETWTSTIAAGGSQLQPGYNYFWLFTDGPVTGCLDGPDGARFSLTLERYVPNERWDTIRTASRPGADKTLRFAGTTGNLYEFRVTAIRGSGTYTFGLDRPARTAS